MEEENGRSYHKKTEKKDVELDEEEQEYLANRRINEEETGK